jgi:hypothetical protein
MMQKLTIENFIKLPFVDIEPEKQVLFFAGGNEVGKSSLAEAIQFVLIDETARVKLKRDRGSMVFNGAKKGSVTIGFDNVSIKRNIKDSKVTGDSQFLNDDIEATRICLQAESFARLPDTQRRGMMLRLAKADLSVDGISAKLKGRGVDAETIKKLRPLVKGGLAGAHAHVKRAVSEARGAWAEITGERYGSQKAETWEPDDPGVEAEDVGEAIATLDTQLSELSAERESALAPIITSIQQYRDQLNKPEPLSCPECGSALIMDDGKLAAYEGEGNRSQISIKLNMAEIKRKKAAEEFDTRIGALREQKVALGDALKASASIKHKKTRAAELHTEIQTNEKLTELLGDGPDGVAAELVSDALKPINARLTEIAQAIGWEPATIQGDISIQRGYPYALLSESAQWRVDAMLLVLISELAEIPWLVFDRMDVLAPPDRPAFLKWLNTYGVSRADEPTIIVLATTKAPPTIAALENIESYWMESGACRRLS